MGFMIAVPMVTIISSCLIVCSMEEKPSDVMRRLLVYTIMMVTLPIFSYFASKAWLFEGIQLYHRSYL